MKTSPEISGMPDDATLAVMQPRSFSDQVSKRLRERQPTLNVEYYTSVPQAYQEGMAKGQHVVLPFENSGSDPSVVWRHIDLIDNDPTASIVGEVHQNVDMCVGGLPETDIAHAHTVRTHPKAMQQSSHYLSSLPGLSHRVEHDSTAQGLEYIATHQEVGAIGLGTREAIEHTGLVVLDDGITNLPANQNITQFLLVHKNGGSLEPDYARERHAALLRMPKGGPGTLVKALNVLKAGGVNLTSLHSRTEDPKADLLAAKYEFFLEMERAGSPEALRTMKEGITQLGYGDMRWLGSWNDRLGPQLQTPLQSPARDLEKIHLDTSSRYHRLLVEPENQPGVLCDILTVVANARVDISHLQSRNVGPKQYVFDLVLDQSTVQSSKDIEYMADALYGSGYLRRVTSVGSSNEQEVLRRRSLSL